jgi:hypothetical protein
MGASPELFREVNGSRIAAVSVCSSKPGDHRTSSCASITVCRQPVADRQLSMNDLVQDNGVTAICCPYSDSVFVQVYIENRTHDFVPRFSIMHGSVESHAAR